MQPLIPRRKLTELALFTAGFIICLVLAWNLNFKDGKLRPGRSIFGSDKSIYYVYLPATFIYGWDVNQFPHHCDTLYRGFILDYKHGKIVNKMTCGVAMLWSPFFMATHAIAVSFDLKADGFSDFYEKMAIIPPVFFLVLGLFFLRRFLAYYFPRTITYLSVVFVLAGTNLYYYGLGEGLMSHVHSFFLFSLYLFLLKKFFETGKSSLGLFAGICAAVSLAILIRPTNLVILLWYPLLDAGSWKEVWARIRLFFRPRYLLTFSAIFLLVFLPQFIYWHYLSGHIFHYSYGGERFLNWADPFILPLYFSPLNGLFAYNPIVLLFIAGAIWMAVRRQPNGILVLLTFALVSYISGSWHMWYFGGSYGSRTFVEYYAILSLGFGFFLAESVKLKGYLFRGLIAFLLVISIYFNLRMIYLPYWYTGSVWSWDDYKIRMERAGIYRFPKNSYTFIQDFENTSFDPALGITRLQRHKGIQASLVDSRFPGGTIFTGNMVQVIDHPITRIDASLWVRPVASDGTGAALAVTIEDEKRAVVLLSKTTFDQFHTQRGNWTEVKASFDIPPEYFDPRYTVKVYLRNELRRSFFVDDIRVKFY